MRCPKCKYKNNPPEEAICLYCGGKTAVSSDKRQMAYIFKKFKVPLSYVRLELGKYVANVYITNRVTMNVEIFNDIRRYIHGKRVTVYTSGTQMEIDIER